ncbi:aromatic acid exporter family protein [Streptomyces sp. RFCAC02]|uniref:aromatic acid exporter family protein n=1 Tax=Streptomyces sp. RFCAC02 TaxID=2499143 RepID=UPI00143D1B92|nr:aromatic acid exporter family protein [Streptomyces sp. RFCAC02]
MRAVRHSGPERDEALLQVRAVLAVVVAWGIASWLLPVSVTTFAPFTSLLALHGTVYRSLWQSLRYMAAVAVGVIVAAAFGSTAGVHLWSLAVVTAAALLASRLPTLGGQRFQVPVTALFAFSAGGGRIDYSFHLVTAVLIGVGCGLAATVFLAPPTRFHDARAAVGQLAGHVGDLLRDMARTLGETTPDPALAQEWSERAARVGGLAGHARDAAAAGEESARLNPRRLPVSRRLAPPAHSTVINALERVGHQAESIARGLAHAARSENYDALARDFLTPYAELLTEAAAAVECLGFDEDRVADTCEDVGAHIEEGRRLYAALNARARGEHLDAPGEWPLYGALLTDAHRALDDLSTALPR